MQANAVNPSFVELDVVINDLGPLAWVLDELRKSLESSSKALKRFVREAQAAKGSDLATLDASQLRLARQQLHQAVGALEMVGLAGPALVLRAMEAVVQKFVQHPELCDQAAALTIEHASFALTEYLEGVLADKPVSAVSLFPQYRDVQSILKADRIHPADLWSVQWRWIEPQTAAAVTPRSYDAEARGMLDQLVLQVMRGKAPVAAQSLKVMCLEFSANAVERHPRIFWKLAGAFFEALAHDSLPSDVYTRRAASRVLMQYASLGRGDTTVSERLAHDLLFFCAQAVVRPDADAPLLSAVRHAYGLARFKCVDYEAVQFGRFDPALLAQARKRIVSAKETWSSLSAGDANKFKIVVDQFSLVTDSLVKLHPPSTPLAQALTRAIEVTARSGQPPPVELSMEVATSVLYLEAAFEDLDSSDLQLAARTQHLAQRLDAVKNGANAQPLESWMEDLYRRVSDKQTMGSVVGELRISLGEVEKTLDGFFRNPQDKKTLSNVPNQLSQMRGVLSVLGLDQASQAVLRMRDSVEQMMAADIDAEQARALGTFEHLGNNLGALSFLIDMLNYQPSLAKKLFVYDDVTGEIRPVMGRVNRPVEHFVEPPEQTGSLSQMVGSVVLEAASGKPSASLAAELETLTLQAQLAEQPTLAQKAHDVSTAVASNDKQAIDSAMAGLATVGAIGAVVAAPDGSAADFDEDDLRDIFLEEAREVTGNGLAALKQLGADPADVNQLIVLRRAFHTLKGSARMVGLSEFGEAAWSMEQLYNSWLADQKPANSDFLALSGSSLSAFSGWIEDIAANRAEPWRCAPFCDSAQAMRTDNRYVALTLPQTAAALPQPDQLDQLDQPSQFSDDAIVEMFALGSGPSILAPDASFDVAAVGQAKTEPGLDADFEIFSNGFAGAEPSPLLLLPEATAAQPQTPEIESIDFDSLSAVSGVYSKVPFEVENDLSLNLHPNDEPAAPLDQSEQKAAQDNADFFDLSAADFDAQFSSAEKSDAVIGLPATDELQAADSTDTAASDEERVKVIGDLRIGIPLYNVFLNEADEWSRRLVTEISEWAMDHSRPVDESAVALAHSLAGSSATVGFTALSDIARSLENCLQLSRSHFSRIAADQYAALFVKAAEDIRRLLHQFAAGFLKESDSQVLAELDGLDFADSEDDAESAFEQGLNDFDLPPEATLRRSEVSENEPSLSAGGIVKPIAAASVLTAAAAGAAFSNVFHLPTFQPSPASTPAYTGDERDDEIDAVDAIDAELFPIFDEEAAELMPQLGLALRQWSSKPGNLGQRNEVLRVLHTLKGSARLAGALRLGEMAHKIESEIESLGTDAAASQEFEPLLARFDMMQQTLEALRVADGLAGASTVSDGSALTSAVTSTPVIVSPAVVSPAVIGPALLFPVRLTPAATTPLVASVLPAASAQPVVQPEELLIADTPTGPAQPSAGAQDMIDPLPNEAAARSMIPAPQAIVTQTIRQAANASIRVRSQLLDRMVNQAGEVMITRSRLEVEMNQLRGSLGDMNDNLNRLRQQLRDIELQAETQMQSRLAQAKELQAGFDPLEFDRFTRVQELTRMMAESVNDVATVQRTLQRTVEATEDDLVAQARQTRQLQRDLLKTRMVEFEGISDRLYRVVRLASKETGKQVKLDLLGGTIEMDRGMLDRMTPAFEHLLRNCVAHGIESPAVRSAAGKDAAGLITVELRQEGNDVSVEFRDDGAGLDLARIREKAISSGLIPADQPLDDQQAANLIFMPGFTTATQVTELSGRGIGMDVVRSEVNAVGGRIETATTPGRGTQFKLVLPLTTAVTQVVMLRSGKLAVGVPANLVETVRRTTAKDLQQAYNSGTFDVGGEAVPFFWSGALLQASAKSVEVQAKNSSVVVFRSAAQRVALHVDEVLGNQEVVVKNLGPQLARLPGLAGMSVLASGAVVLIYNPVALASVYGVQARALSADSAEPHMLEGSAVGGADEGAPILPAAVPRIPLVMVVDDSITVRRVTQRLLQREGYRVVLAADGLQALERLQEERPAVVLSDIEMPRMDGFDLARNIRGDARLKDLPIVMITSRIAEKHREYAKELGVDHYLGKPYPEDELMGLVRHYCSLEVVA